MKIVLCKGGLGNQMFQYAFYVMMSHFHKCSFDYTLFNHFKMHNGFELPSIFQLRKNDRFSTMNYTLYRVLGKWRKFPCFKDQLRYIAGIQNGYFIIYDGEWQSEKWFKDCKNEVINAFSFKYISEKNIKEASIIQCNESVSIHVRRGDYVGNNTYANCATKDYYIRAIDYIKSKYPECRFWVFSNEIDWCKENLIDTIGNKVSFVDWNTGNDSYQDMYLMSQCKHNIIANSSFSWWGAYLNKNEDKIVVAPEKWFNTNFPEHFKDIVPSKWLKL